ncbi:MAG TPA: thioredoxin domain-containing protein, partial [Bacillota bacterium]|nr:thioredoxin domain-containing protein [Bacillota bacterium]
IVIVGSRRDENAKRMIKSINSHFNPFTVVLFKDSDEAGDEITSIAPYTEAQGMVDDRTTAYVCENFACMAPVTDLQEFENALK